MFERVVFSISIGLAMLASSAVGADEEVIDIGSRRELFVDHFLIQQMNQAASLKVQRPEPREVVLVTDQPWEGNTSAYYTILRDGELYQMYYRGSHADQKTQKSLHEEVTCYAESRDGVHWTKPNLGLFPWEGSKANNIVWRGIGTHNFTPFIDTNPATPPEARYKAIARGRPKGQRGLYIFQSPDGRNWTMMNDKPVITDGAFDSQNLAFWDPLAEHYVEYHRSFVNKVRSIMMATSRDFVNWTKPKLLEYPGAAPQHLYTNAIRPYERAPHIRIGFPTRYLPKTSQVEPLFMSSRDGITFQRFDKPVIPRTAPSDRDGNRSNYMANGLVTLPGRDHEYSVYASEAYYTGPDSRLRRFTYRVDGFVSASAGDAQGELITKPLRFTGDELRLNALTQTGGSVRVELQDAGGRAIDGFQLARCEKLEGDHVDQPVTWKGAKGVSRLSGRTVRLRFVFEKADLFAFQFARK